MNKLNDRDKNREDVEKLDDFGEVPFGDRGLRDEKFDDHFSPKSMTGIGPKSYQRDDKRLMEVVCEALTKAPHIDASDVEVKVNEGIVTLTGTVNENKERFALEYFVNEIWGVKDVENRLRLKKDFANAGVPHYRIRDQGHYE